MVTFNPEPTPQNRPCISPSHAPPMGLYIPAGQTYVHTCPGCGMQVHITTPTIMFQEPKYDIHRHVDFNTSINAVGDGCCREYANPTLGVHCSCG